MDKIRQKAIEMLENMEEVTEDNIIYVIDSILLDLGWEHSMFDNRERTPLKMWIFAYKKEYINDNKINTTSEDSINSEEVK